MKIKIYIQICSLILILLLTCSCTTTSNYIDAQQQTCYPYYGDINYWRNCNLDSADFATLFTLYKRRIISKAEYRSLLMRLSKNPYISTIIYKNRLIDIQRDLEISIYSIRAVLSTNEKKNFYRNLIYSIPAENRIGPLNNYLQGQDTLWNYPPSLFQMLFQVE